MPHLLNLHACTIPLQCTDSVSDCAVCNPDGSCKVCKPGLLLNNAYLCGLPGNSCEYHTIHCCVLAEAASIVGLQACLLACCLPTSSLACRPAHPSTCPQTCLLASLLVCNLNINAHRKPVLAGKVSKCAVCKDMRTCKVCARGYVLVSNICSRRLGYYGHGRPSGEDRYSAWGR